MSADDADRRGYEGFGGTVAPLASQSSPWWPPRRAAPSGAPNVVVVLVDDMGFSDVSPFGAEIDTPAIQALADDGYRFSDFRTTPVCSPSRAALLTGVNPHRAGFGTVAHADPGFPGYRMLLPENLPTLAESFGQAGYATFMVGKWHLTLESHLHDAADRSSWPIQRGFDRYFGSMDGCTSLYHPHRIIRDNSAVTEAFADDEYLTDRLTDEAIGMIDALRANDADAPFFLYFAHQAVHGPVQAKPADIEKYRGSYDAGWEQVGRERFERQKAIGLFPDAEAPGSADGIPNWDDLDQDSRELYTRHMEVYAAAVDAVDQSLAKLVARLKELGEYENTIFVFTSDNGGTGEGGVSGTRSYFSRFTLTEHLPADWEPDVPRALDEMGGPRVFGHYPTGWARVSNTPFRMYKGSVFEGGVHAPLIISWPAGIPKENHDDGVRRTFSYVTDIAPTLLDLAAVGRPTSIRGHDSEPIDGVSLVPVLNGSDPDGRPVGQYLAHRVQRAYYLGRWKGVATSLGGEDDVASWQLYDLESDPFETRNVASEHPETVSEIAENWRRSAWNNTVFPLDDDGSLMRTRPSTDLRFAQPVTLRPGTPTLERWRSQQLVGLRSFSIEAAFDGLVGEGVIVSHGDQGGGYILYAEAGVLHFAYNAYGVMHRVSASVDGSVATVETRFRALPDFAWSIVIAGDGVELMRLDRVPMLIGLSPFTGISAGFDGGSPVDWDLHTRRGEFPHSGQLQTVRYVPGESAPYDPRVIAAIGDASDRLLD